MKYLTLAILFLYAQSALAGDFFGITEDNLSTFIGWFVAIQAACFALGKGLTEIAVMTENKYDNAVANGFTKVAWFMGVIISKFGWSMPKQVVLEKAEKLQDGKS